MHPSKLALFAIACSFLIAIGCQSTAEKEKVAANSAAVDNSKVNAEIYEQQALTAQDQGESDSDMNLTRRIRQEVVAQDALSMNAKNIKIITIKGVVTLKGPVKSTAEKNRIQKIATNLAGRTKVINEISVE